ncbi:hypothetical protein D3C71_1246710 [compost metagenome]
MQSIPAVDRQAGADCGGRLRPRSPCVGASRQPVCTAARFWKAGRAPHAPGNGRHPAYGGPANPGRRQPGQQEKALLAQRRHDRRPDRPDRRDRGNRPAPHHPVQRCRRMGHHADVRLPEAANGADHRRASQAGRRAGAGAQGAVDRSAVRRPEWQGGRRKGVQGHEGGRKAPARSHPGAQVRIQPLRHQWRWPHPRVWARHHQLPQRLADRPAGHQPERRHSGRGHGGQAQTRPPHLPGQLPDQDQGRPPTPRTSGAGLPGLAAVRATQADHRLRLRRGDTQ